MSEPTEPAACGYRIRRARRNVNRIPIVASLNLNAWLDIGWVCGWLSRVLLLLVAVELITMPITQHFWTWDQFLHGGQDFEMGLLMVVTCLCFVLLRTQHCRQNLGLLLAIGRLRLRVLQRRERVRLLQFRQLSADPDDPLSNIFSCLPALPLLI